MRKYLSIFLFIVLLLLMQTSVSAVDNSNQSYFVYSPDGKYLAKVFYTSRKTWIKIHETDGMGAVAQWQIPDFQPHTVQFSAHDSTQILLADERRFLVYDLQAGHPEVKLVHPETAGQKIIHAAFDVDKNQIVWATKNKVFKTDLEKKQDHRVASIEKDEGLIKSIVPLSGGRLVVILEGSSKIYLFSAESPLFSEMLNGHRSPLAGVQSPQGQVLFSLDENRELFIWDVSRRKIIRSLYLDTPDSGSKVKGVSLDDPKKHLLVQTYSDPAGNGQRYAIVDLLNGRIDSNKLSILVTSAGNIYATAENFSSAKLDKGEILNRRKTRSVPYKPKNQNSFYDLAKIEADNENYEAALDFIKRIPLNDPEFKQSRELRKHVRGQIEMKNAFNAALQQYETGNLESAKILLENILAKHPDNPVIKRYLALTETKLSKGMWLKTALTLMILILLGFIGFFAWRYQDEIRKKIGVSPKKPGEKPEEKSSSKMRREFILKLDETKRMLKKAVSLDRSGKLKDKWIEFSATLTSIESRAKKKDKFLPDLGVQLSKMQERILKLSPGSKVPRKKQETVTPSEEIKKKKSSGSSSDKKPLPSLEAPPGKKTKPDYYQVLGIGQKATADQIKKAYHQKMREYHPDKHNASDFGWVKEEASRMTQMVQEAYSVLSDPQKRRQYQS